MRNMLAAPGPKGPGLHVALTPGRRGPGLHIVAAVVLSLLPLAGQPGAQEPPILAAMRDELARSMKQLRMRDEPPPYYIEYEIEDRMSSRITARLGAIVEDLWAPSRGLRVEVRVGDYQFDSSLFNAPVRGSGVIQLAADGSTVAPLDDDYDALRRQIWLATDAAYKRAVNVFARKKAAFQNRAATESLPDFAREKPEENVFSGVPLALVNREWPDRTKQLSAVFNNATDIDASDVAVGDTRGTRYYLNSEGTKAISPIEIASIRVSAEARADDGMTIRDALSIIEKNLTDMPPMPELLARTRDFANRVVATRRAPFGDEYTGPVLVEGQASAEIVAQTLVPALLARRPPENQGGGGRGGGGAPQTTPFLRRIGLRVLSEPFSLSDTPSLKSFGGRPVAGSYAVDEHGLRPKDVTLVEKGRLQTLLTGRAPLKALPQSNGHWRGGAVQPGVLQMHSSQAVPGAELRRQYLELLKTQESPFGYIVRAVANPTDMPVGGGPSVGPIILNAVKVTPGGKEELVRGIRFGAIPPATFRDLLEGSSERTLYSYRLGPTESASVIVPNLIFEELEIQRSREVMQKPPIVRSPIAGPPRVPDPIDR
jgi:hypothetical protein